MAEPKPNTESGMIGCPVCGTDLEPWQIYCHSCGQSISSFEIPIIKADEVFETDLSKAYGMWMRRGKRAYKSASYDEAKACFAEALKRVNGLPAQRGNELKARVKLSEACLKLNKVNEAIDQLERAAELAPDERQKSDLGKRVESLKAQFGQGGHVLGLVKFRQPKPIEYMSNPLYCARCSRLLSESEVYRFRSKRDKTATCICGFVGVPITPEVLPEKASRSRDSGLPLSRRKALLIEAAQGRVKGGRDKRTATWLAIILGGIGVHKFYLGERVAGLAYLVLSWTLIPWMVELYEAVHIAQMSRVGFNLVYNFDAVIQRLPEESIEASDGTVFSMEVTEGADDLVDEWSQGDETASVLASNLHSN